MALAPEKHLQMKKSTTKKAEGYIVQTLPKKPKSPLQRYRLLRKGEGCPGMNTTYTVKHIQKGPTLFVD